MVDRGRDAVRGLGNEMHVTDALGEGGQPEKAAEPDDDGGTSGDDSAQEESRHSNDEPSADPPA